MSFRPFDDFAQDLRFAIRTLRCAPGFTLAAVLTLAIGIGGNTAIFSAVDGVMLKPLPFSHAERLVRLYQTHRKKGLDRLEVAPGNYADWVARSNAFAAIAAVEPYGEVYEGAEGEEQLRTWNVTRDFFVVLDARPLLGRVFDENDFVPGIGNVAVLTYESWQQRFGGDPATVGRAVRLDHRPVTIIGVLPRDFAYLGARMPQEMYLPKVLDSIEVALRGDGWYNAVARLAPGVSAAQAQADLQRVAVQIASEYPRTNADIGASVVPLRDGMIGDTSRALILLLGAVGLVLLIACTNVASLMLARTNRRAREFAVRAALGAARGRIVRQVLTESFLVALIGGLAGVAVAYWGIGVIRGAVPSSIPRADEMRVDERALGFTLAAVVIATFVFGLGPALRAARREGGDELKGGARAAGLPPHRVRGALVTFEVAMAVVLLVSAGLLVRSFVSVVGADRGYRSDHVLGATLFIWKSNPAPSQRRAFVTELLRRAAALPGVKAAGVTSSPPLAAAIGLEYGPFSLIGRIVPPDARAHITASTPGAFAVLDVHVRRGRSFTPEDDSSSAAVAIVNESFVRQYFAGENPVGGRVRVGFYGAPVEREIVGVVPDMPQSALDGPPVPAIYLPHAQAPTGAIWLVLRTSTPPGSLARDVKRLVAELSPGLPVAGIQSFDEIAADSLKPRRFTLLLFGCFSAVALALAIVGVFGVMTHAVSERVRELAVRVALGAEPADIVRLVMRQGLTPTIAGVLTGTATALAVSRLLSGMLFGVSAIDPATYVAVAALMLGTAMVACYIPARRATRVDPMAALRIG
jgi:predicted permease